MNIGKMMYIATQEKKHSVVEKKAAFRLAKKAGLSRDKTFIFKSDCDAYCKSLKDVTGISYHSVPCYSVYF